MRPARKARGGRIPGVCNRRATPRPGMQRRPNVTGLRGRDTSGERRPSVDFQRWLHGLPLRWRSLSSAGQLDRDLDDEITHGGRPHSERDSGRPRLVVGRPAGHVDARRHRGPGQRPQTRPTADDSVIRSQFCWGSSLPTGNRRPETGNCRCRLRHRRQWHTRCLPAECPS